MVTITCQQCGKEFEVYPYRSETARFCSRACKGKWHSQIFSGDGGSNWQGGKVIVICEQCGRKFKVAPHKRETRKFCSRKCKSMWQSEHYANQNGPNWKGGRITIVCEQCGKEFGVFPHREETARFCSFECSSEHKRIPVFITCEQCGNKFIVTPSRSDAARFCSRRCMDENHTGENHPSWKGGKSFEPYPPTFNESFKRKIRERDDYTCAICRRWGNDVHHINYIKDDTTPQNCITLCHSCHSVTGINRSYWQNALSAIIQVRIDYEIVLIHRRSPLWYEKLIRNLTR